MGAARGEEIPGLPSYRGEVTLYPTSKRPRERRVSSGEWMLISPHRGLWMPHVFEGESTLVFRKRGPEVFVIREGGQEQVVGIRLGTLDGRVELRTAIAAGLSPLTIWCYPAALQDLPELPSGRYYALAVDGVGDLRRLAHLRQLSALKVGCRSGVVDLSALARLGNLESLWLSGAGSSDLTPLAELANLRVLRLDYCPRIADLAPLGRLRNLRVLEIEGAERLSDLGPLAELPNLSILVLKRCPNVPDIAPLAKLPELTWLGLHGCPLVADLAPLRQMKRLATIELNGCPNLRDLAPLASVATLEAVSLQECPNLADISPLASLARLCRLELLDCPRVSDLWPLRRAAQQPHKFSLDWRLANHASSVPQAAPGRVTLLMDGILTGSAGVAPEGLGEGDGWANILGRFVRPKPALGLNSNHLPYPVSAHEPGTVLNFTLEGPNVYLLKEQGPRQLIGVIACSKLGLDALRQAIADGASPLIIWADPASIGELPALPPGRDYTLAVLGLRAPLEPLARVGNLAGLYLAHCGTEASTLKPIAHLTGLRTLVLRDSPGVDSLAHLARMGHLTSLDISLTPGVRDLSPLARLGRLRTLRLSCPRQTDFSPLASLPNLEELVLHAGEACSDLSSLGKLTRLRRLSLRTRGRATSLDFLAALPRLEALRLDGFAALTDLAAVSAARNLHTLILRSCGQVRDLRPLLALPKLRYLDIAACPSAGDLPTLLQLRSLNVQLALDGRLWSLLPEARLGLSRASLPSNTQAPGSP